MCAFTSVLELICWGRNNASQMGNGGLIDLDIPTVINTDVLRD